MSKRKNDDEDDPEIEINPRGKLKLRNLTAVPRTKLPKPDLTSAVRKKSIPKKTTQPNQPKNLNDEQQSIDHDDTDVNSFSVESIDGLHTCHEFIRMARNDPKLTFKPDWNPKVIHRRLTYKRDMHWYFRAKPTISCTNFFKFQVFSQTVRNGHSFMACVRTKNLQCVSSDQQKFRMVF